MTTHSLKHQHGFTLIELLLYISIVGALLLGISLFFITTTESNIKNQTISEVNEQGELAMGIIAQTIRNANSITSPAAGASSTSLTLDVPTGALSPTIFSLPGSSSVLGYNQIGASTDESNANSMNTTEFVASASGTITSLNAHVGAVDSNPNNKAQMAIYSGASTPSTFLASSASVTLVSNSWNSFPISSVSITAGQKYWLVYNTNSSNIFLNNLHYHTVATSQSRYTAQTYNTWPASWNGTTQDVEFSMYATVTTGGGSSLQIKEGAGSEVPLTNDRVQVSSLSFTNLSRGSTPGIVQFSFTISRINNSGRNEYDYQKTFTGSAALRWP